MARTSHVMSVSVRFVQIKSVQLRSSQVISNRVRSGQCQVWPGQGQGQVRSVQVRLGRF